MIDAEPVRVLIVDDHELFRHGVLGSLKRHPQVEVVGEAADGVEAIEKARELMPDVILMDINMPRMDGIEATRWLKEEFPYVRIVVLTVSDLDENLFSALKAGASGYLLKNVGAQQLVDGIVGAARGEAPLSGAVAARILQELRGPGRRLAGQPHPGSSGTSATARLEAEPAAQAASRRVGMGAGEKNTPLLTPREQEVLTLVSQGLTSKEIADRLFISVYTVKNHIRNVLEKLHLKNRAEAVAFAAREGLLDRPQA